MRERLRVHQEFEEMDLSIVRACVLQALEQVQDIPSGGLFFLLKGQHLFGFSDYPGGVVLLSVLWLLPLTNSLQF